MPLYAGVSEVTITPPVGVWLSGYALRPAASQSVHDDLYARALVLDNGRRRLCLVALDVIAADAEFVARVRAGAEREAGIAPTDLLLSCTHTHSGPCVYPYRGLGLRDEPYLDVLPRAVIGAVRMAADRLEPAQLTYGDASAQVGVNRRCSAGTGRPPNYAGPVDPLVRTICVNRPDGKTFALLASHACHPTTLGRENLAISADWPGAAAARLKERFSADSAQSGIEERAVPFVLQGCCGDINPVRRGDWEAVRHNGVVVADAAHTARWGAHGRLDDTLEATEETIALPMLPPPPVDECERQVGAWTTTLQRDREAQAERSRLLYDEGWLSWAEDALRVAASVAASGQKPAEQPFTIQWLNVGGVQILGFPAEMFVQYQLDFAAQCRTPVLALGCANGCWNYLPTAAEYARGGYEVDTAYKYYGTLMYAPDAESRVRAAAYRLLGVEDPDWTPYPLDAGR